MGGPRRGPAMVVGVYNNIYTQHPGPWAPGGVRAVMILRGEGSGRAVPRLLSIVWGERFAPRVCYQSAWCSGHHIRLTRGRSPVQSRALIFRPYLQRFGARCQCGSEGAQFRITLIAVHVYCLRQRGVRVTQFNSRTRNMFILQHGRWKKRIENNAPIKGP